MRDYLREILDAFIELHPQALNGPGQNVFKNGDLANKTLRHSISLCEATLKRNQAIIAINPDLKTELESNQWYYTHSEDEINSTKRILEFFYEVPMIERFPDYDE